MIEITRKIEFCSGHRVTGHETKCKHLHGHNYTAYFTVRSRDDQLDGIGRVIDFAVVKELLKGWIDENWDHRFLIYEEDPLKDALLAVHAESIVPLKFNPTAECMAIHLLEIANALLPPFIECTAVELQETPNCSARYRAPWAK